jgi:taurine dioxygenase/sulfonate dioxygenase
MAPSIAEAAKSEVVVPVKADVSSTVTKPKIRRVIDEEGGTTTATVCSLQPLLNPPRLTFHF